jgi:ribonuclease HI
VRANAHGKTENRFDVSEQESYELQVVREIVAQNIQRQPLARDDGKRFTAYTDGSCLRNPDGPSGFAAIVQSEASGQTWELAGHLTSSTNNRAEWAALAAVLLFVPSPGTILAYTDSQYVLQVATGRWKRKANLDIWQAWDGLRTEHPVELELRWVRGHAADPGNERADALATLAAFKFNRPTWEKARAVPEPVRAVQQLQSLARGDWETRFIKDIASRTKRGQRLSPKQQAILDRIAARGENGKE